MVAMRNNHFNMVLWLMCLYQYLLRFTFSQNLTSFSSSSLTYDSTTLNLLSYTHSQGLLGLLSYNNLVYVQNLNHTLQEQGLSLIVGLLFARVVYVNPGNAAREYLFGFTSESTIEGYSIPVIDSTNNHGTNLFFRDKYLFSIRYTTNPVISSSSSNYLGFAAFYDSSSSTSSSIIFSFFLCTASNGLLQATSIDLKTYVTFTAYQPAVSIGVNSCSALSKLSNLYLLLNAQYICNISTNICSIIPQISQNPSRTVFQNGIIRATSFSYFLNTSTTSTYTWLSSSADSVEYIFDYQNTGGNLLFIVQESSAVSLQIRDGTDDTQLIFKGYLSGITSLNSMRVLYESSQELYLISTLSSSTAGIQIFCIDSSYNSSTFTCTNTNISNCLFESESKCLQCASSYYADSSSGLCKQCSSKCLDGCSTETVCSDCQGSFRNPANTCSCIAPRIEPTRLLASSTQGDQILAQYAPFYRQLSSIYDCVCPANQIIDSNQNCATCTDVFGNSCSTCNQSSCTSCLANAYLQTNGTCLICSSIDAHCESCDSSGCLTCGIGFYLSSSNTCTSCQQDMIGCNACSSAAVCTLCNLDSYLNSSKTCSACSSECVGGCLSELVCNGCAALSMDKTNQCACTGGMIKTTSDTCECDTSSYWDSITSTCELCTDQFSSQCLTCNSATCTGCEQEYYVSSVLSGKCDICSNIFSKCVSCQSDKCTSCAPNFYVNSAGSCSPCSSNCVGGCSSASVCTSCSDSLRDPSNSCACAANRVENPSSFLCECPSNAYEDSPPTLSCPLCTTKFGTGCLSCTLSLCTECSGQAYYYSSDDMKCGLCSADFGETCLDCSSSGCNTCGGGATVNSLGICTCALTQFLYSDPSTSAAVCKECSVAYASSCKSCDTSTCLDCSDSHAIYHSITNECLCQDSYYISAASTSEDLLCVSCADTFTSQCKSCSVSGCSSCSAGYSVDNLTKSCECPENSTIISQTCTLCTELYGQHCSTCDGSTCLTCDSPYRIPSSNCSCRSTNAVEFNDQCFQCDLTQSSSSSLALTSSYSFSLVCNFASDSDYASTGIYSFYILKSFSAMFSSESLHALATQTSKILISSSATISNIQLPHGESTILATYTNTDYPTLDFSISTNLNVTKFYTNFSDIYTKYFSLQTPLQLYPTKAILYLAQSLEIKQLLGDVSLEQTSLCSTLSSEGSLCSCFDTDKYFFDCSGSIAEYAGMQEILVQYVQFMNSRENTLTSLQEQIFTSTLNILEPLIDTSFLATHSTQISLLLNYLAFQLTLIDGSTYLPTNFQEIAQTIVSSIDAIVTSSIASSDNIQSALSILAKLQGAVLLTIDPFYTQTSTMPDACLLVESTYLVIQQQLFACSSSTANIANITLAASLGSSSSTKLRTLPSTTTPNCYVLPSTDTTIISQTKYYFGLSKATFKSNPWFSFTNFPYADQDFEYFVAQLQPFTSSRRRNRRSLAVPPESSLFSSGNLRFLATSSSSLSSSSSNDYFLISFPVITSNPKNATMTLDTTLLRCIFLNTTTPTNTKWSKCLSHSYQSTSNTLLCRCPSYATYVFDYDDLFQDSSENAANDSAKQKQTTLIIVAAILAAAFIVVIILYAVMNKPTQPVEFEHAQIRQSEETNSLAVVGTKMQGNVLLDRQTEIINLQGLNLQQLNTENEHAGNNTPSFDFLPSQIHPKRYQFLTNHYKSSCFSPVSLSNNKIHGNSLNDSRYELEWNEQIPDNGINQNINNNFRGQTIFDEDHNQTFAQVAANAEKPSKDFDNSNGQAMIMGFVGGCQTDAINIEGEHELECENPNKDNAIDEHIQNNQKNIQLSKLKLENVVGAREADENLSSLVDKNVSLIKSSAETPSQQQRQQHKDNNNNNNIQVSFARKTIDRSISSGLKTNEILINFEIENAKNIEISSDTCKQSNSKQMQTLAKNSNCDKSNEDDSVDQEDQAYFDEQHKVIFPNNTQFSPTHSSFSKLQLPASISLIATAQRIPVDVVTNSRKSSKSEQRNLTLDEDQKQNSNEDSKELIQLE